MSATFLEQTPTVHEQVVVGPGLWHGAKRVHLVKDRERDLCFEVGTKEAFLIARLDGTRTLADLGACYTAEFGRRLDERNWAVLLRLLHERQLLAGRRLADPREWADWRGGSGGDAGSDRSAGPGGSAGSDDPSRRRRLPLTGQVSLGDPTRLVRRLERWLSWCFRASVAVPAAVASAAMCVVLAAHIPLLLTEFHVLRGDPTMVLVALPPIWLAFAVHEIAHGVAARHYGGDATGIGIRWAFPFLYFYCQTQDIRLFAATRHRVATAAAGVWASLVLMLPLFAAWTVLPDTARSKDALGLVLGFTAAQGVFNLLPLPGLDGYRMLSHRLGVLNLSTESFRYVRLWFGRGPGKRSVIEAYPAALRRTYGGYAALVALLLGAGFAASCLLTLHVFPGLPGRLAVAVFTLAAALQLAVKTGVVKTRERPTKEKA